MVVRLAAKLAIGTTKFTIRHVIVPLAYAAILGAAISAAAEKIREATPKAEAVIQPEP